MLGTRETFSGMEGLLRKQDGGGGALPYFSGVTHAVLVLLGEFGVKKCTVRAFAVPFRILSRKK